MAHRWNVDILLCTLLIAALICIVGYKLEMKIVDTCACTETLIKSGYLMQDTWEEP